MSRFDELHPQYITDEKGEKTSGILPLPELAAAMEDVEDLVKVAERREEPTLSHPEPLESPKRDGLL